MHPPIRTYLEFAAKLFGRERRELAMPIERHAGAKEWRKSAVMGGRGQRARA